MFSTKWKICTILVVNQGVKLFRKVAFSFGISCVSGLLYFMKRNEMMTKPVERHTSQISVCDKLKEGQNTGSAEFLNFTPQYSLQDFCDVILH